MATCFDNPLSDWFEPIYGYDQDGNRKGSQKARAAWEKRKQLLREDTGKFTKASNTSSDTPSILFARRLVNLICELRRFKASSRAFSMDFARRSDSCATPFDIFAGRQARMTSFAANATVRQI